MRRAVLVLLGLLAWALLYAPVYHLVADLVR